MSKQKQIKQSEQPKFNPEWENIQVRQAAFEVACAMMAKGVYQYPLSDFDIDRMTVEAVKTAKRLIERIKLEASR